jgi:hypothetical protein
MKTKKVKAEETPKVGIFWVDLKGRKLKFIFSDPVRSLEISPGVESVSGDYEHLAIWEKLKRQDLLPSKWRDKEYEYIPRGRVTFNTLKKKYFVYTSKKVIGNKWFRNQVVFDFSLPRNTTEFESDIHYEDPSELWFLQKDS